MQSLNNLKFCTYIVNQNIIYLINIDIYNTTKKKELDMLNHLFRY